MPDTVINKFKYKRVKRKFLNSQSSITYFLNKELSTGIFSFQKEIEKRYQSKIAWIESTGQTDWNAHSKDSLITYSPTKEDEKVLNWMYYNISNLKEPKNLRDTILIEPEDPLWEPGIFYSKKLVNTILSNKQVIGKISTKDDNIFWYSKGTGPQVLQAIKEKLIALNPKAANKHEPSYYIPF